jgi:threonine/homoserine/homoserine lactone efflux protein
MLEHIIIGGGFAFAAAAQPGPLQAFLLSRILTDGWRRTLPAAFAPLISDGPIAVLILTLLHNVTPGFETVLKGIGGVVFLYFAVKTFSEWRRMRLGRPSITQSSPRTLSQAVIVNLLNPGPYLGWSLILGPLALEAWAENPAYSVALVVSFYSVMLLSLALFIVLVGTTSFLGSKGRQGLVLASAFALAGIAFYSLWSSLAFCLLELCW